MQSTAQRTVEILKHFRRHSVDHLLMELRIALERFKSVGHGNFVMVQINGAEIAASGCVVVHDFEPIVAENTLFALNRPVRYLDGHSLVACTSEHRIEGKDAKPSALGTSIAGRSSH